MLIRVPVALAVVVGAPLFLGSIHQDCAAVAARSEQISSRRQAMLATHSSRLRTGPSGPWPRSVRFRSDEARDAYRARCRALREKRERHRQESLARSTE
jgi:hypothetical protein